MSSWQQENETARRRDHSELVEMGRQLKQGNVVIMSELCLHGTTLSELSDAVNVSDVSAFYFLVHRRFTSPQNISFMMSRQHTPESSRLSSSSFETRQRSASFSTTPPLARSSGNPTDPTYAGKARRLSMPGSSFTRFSGTAPGHYFESTSEANRVASQTIDARATPFQTPLSSLSKDLPPTPPPSYRSDSFRSVSSQVVPPNDQHTAPPRPDVPLRPKLTKRSDSATSRIIVTAENHPVSSVQTTYDAPRVADGRLLVELCIAPSSASLQSSIISLKSFSEFSPILAMFPFLISHAVPLAAEHLNLAQEYAKVISDVLRPMLLQVRAGVDHEGILLLCPRGMCPSVVKLGKKPRRQLNLVKAYILNTPAKMTLVSVMYKRKISHVLIRECPTHRLCSVAFCSLAAAYTGEMSVNHAKEFVVQHYGNITIQSCRHVDRNVELKDVDTLGGIGVQAYRHNLTMTVARSHNRQ